MCVGGVGVNTGDVFVGGVNLAGVDRVVMVMGVMGAVGVGRDKAGVGTVGNDVNGVDIDVVDCVGTSVVGGLGAGDMCNGGVNSMSVDTGGVGMD